MADLSWLSHEAKTLHLLFSSIFYGFSLTLLMIGVVIEYFKLPLGGTPQFAHLAGRFLVAAILLNSYPDVSNLIADFTDALSNQIGSLNNIKLVLARNYDKLLQFQVSWTSIKDSILMLISFVTFFLLYISVYIADAAITYAWVLLYVFSPLLIALYVLPSTSGATKALYRSLLEVGAWKIVWSVLATLLWSAALSGINQSQNNVNFITAVSFNLILAASLLMTPFVVNALAGAGIASLAAQTAGISAGAASFSPGQLLTKTAQKMFKKDEEGGGQPGSNDTGGQWSNFEHRFMGDEKMTPSGQQPVRRQAVGVRTAQTAQASTAVAPAAGPVVVTAGSSSSQSMSSGASFKSAVNQYKPPINRSEYQKRPIQQAIFEESRKTNSKSKSEA